MGNAAARLTMGVAFAALAATQMLAAGNRATYRVSGWRQAGTADQQNRVLLLKCFGKEGLHGQQFAEEVEQVVKVSGGQYSATCIIQRTTGGCAAAAVPAAVQLEWPATWCYLSVAMCFVALGAELYSSTWAAQQACQQSGRKAHGQNGSDAAAKNKCQ